MLFVNRTTSILGKLIWKRIALMLCIISKLLRMMVNLECANMSTSYFLLEWRLLEKLICMNCLLRNLDLLNLQMLLLAILCLAYWLVSTVTICAFILIITSLGFFRWPIFISGGLRYYGVVDQVVFRHVSSKNTRVVFRMKDLRLWFTTIFSPSYIYLVIASLYCQGFYLPCWMMVICIWSLWSNRFNVVSLL